MVGHMVAILAIRTTTRIVPHGEAGMREDGRFWVDPHSIMTGIVTIGMIVTEIGIGIAISILQSAIEARHHLRRLPAVPCTIKSDMRDCALLIPAHLRGQREGDQVADTVMVVHGRGREIKAFWHC